jgi:hypothetical protein
LADLVRLGKLRWRIEHDYREPKTGLGLDQERRRHARAGSAAISSSTRLGAWEEDHAAFAVWEETRCSILTTDSE